MNGRKLDVRFRFHWERASLERPRNYVSEVNPARLLTQENEQEIESMTSIVLEAEVEPQTKVLFNLVHKISIVCFMRTLFVVALIFWEFSNAFRLTVIAMWIIKTVTLIRRPRPQ